MNVIVLGIAAALALLVFCFFLGWVVTSSTHRGKVRRHSVAGEDVFLPTSAMFLADSSAHESHGRDGHHHHGHHGHHSHNHSGAHSHSHHDSGHHGHADHSGGFDAGSHAGHGGGFDGGGSFDAGGGGGHH